MDYIFVKFFGLDLGLKCFWSWFPTLGLEICRYRPRSWSQKDLGLGLGFNVCGLDYIIA